MRMRTRISEDVKDADPSFDADLDLLPPQDHKVLCPADHG